MHWISANWFNIFQTVVLVGTLAIASSALRSSSRSTKGANLLAMTAAHRNIWQQVITNPDLKRVLRPTMAENEEPTDMEREFALQVFHHSGAVFEILRMGGIDPRRGYRLDVHDSMGLPVFRIVWDECKKYQEADYVAFVESCIAGENLDDPVGRKPRLGWHVIRVPVDRILHFPSFRSAGDKTLLP